MFSFTSPIDTIMEKENFKIEELLVEDDILQEIKSNNMQLVDKLCEFESVEIIVKYICEPAPEGADDIRVHKYPYMACEVLCCEVSTMIDVIVEARNGELMNKLFSIVTCENLIQNRLAGYFEKILQVLFKRKSIAVLAFLDSKGTDLFKSFCNQLHNYSIMQAMRILLLPAVQLAREDSAVGYMVEENELSSTPPSSLVCIWHKDPTLITYLVEQLTNNSNNNLTPGLLQDRIAHISELLTSVIDLSARDSMFHSTMISAKMIETLSSVAIPKLPESSSSASLDLDVSMAAVLAVLEVVVMQFCDEHGTMMSELVQAEKIVNPGKDEDVSKVMLEEMLKAVSKPSVEAVDVLASLVPRMTQYLKGSTSSNESISTQSGVKLPKLGLGRLRIVNLVEGMLRMKQPKIDQVIHDTKCVSLVLDLFSLHEWHSLLHQGAMSCVMLIVEGGDTPERVALQNQLIAEAKLLQTLMKIIGGSPAGKTEPKSGIVGPLGRPGQFGHAVVMCESLMKGIVAGGSMADAVSNSPDSDAWHDFMLATLSEVTTVQCKPTGGFAYPSRHEDVMVGFGGSDTGGSDDLSMDDDVSDESLAEQISKLGLQYGNMFMSGSGTDNGDGDDSDEEEEAALAMALAAAYGKGSSLGGPSPAGGSSLGGNPTATQAPTLGDDSDDDEEEEAKIAAMMMSQYGAKKDVAVTSVEVVSEQQPPQRRDTPLYPKKEDVNDFGGFADFGSAPPASNDGGFADFGSATPASNDGGFADFGSAPPASSASTNTTEVAKQAPSDMFGDFSDTANKTPISPAPKSSPSPPPSGFGAFGVDSTLKSTPTESAAKPNPSLDFDAF